ncbi:MAG: hypothetical protein AB8B55_13005 [Mariniblastus sp.]
MDLNRRKFLRLNSDRQQCVVRLGIGESGGFVVDESIEGLRVGGLDLLILFADQKVMVEFNDETITGRCRGISRGEGGYFEVGIFRETADYVEDTESILLNSFMSFNGKNIAVVPIGIVGDDQLRIRLINGKEFTIDRDKVLQITRQERLEELCNDEALAGVMEVYRLMDSSNGFTNRASVLDHEFGPALRSLSST